MSNIVWTKLIIKQVLLDIMLKSIAKQSVIALQSNIYETNVMLAILMILYLR